MPYVARGLSEEAYDMPSGAASSFDDHFSESFASSGSFDEHFSSMALRDEFIEGPIYRSMRGFVQLDDGDGLTYDDEPPVYRSLSGMAPAGPLHGAEDADQSWLETMPPLIRRQNAFPHARLS